MQRWHVILVSVVLWLVFGALGLKWVSQPYQWILVADLCGCKDLSRLRNDFRVHVAPFPAANAAPAQTDEEVTLDPAIVDWSWRESLGRFGIVFGLWMATGWLGHWFVGRASRSR